LLVASTYHIRNLTDSLHVAKMSNYLHHINPTAGGGTSSPAIRITIPEAVTEDNITFYLIRVDVADISWSVKRRYRDFAQLHETLIEAAGVSKETLPEKKRIGNRDPSFIMRRRRDLESYLQSVFLFLQCSIPPSMVSFLHLNRFDVNFLLLDMAGAFTLSRKKGNFCYVSLAMENLSTGSEGFFGCCVGFLHRLNRSHLGENILK
jgi:hypothetical protein